MFTELQEVYDSIMQSVRCEDLFGDLSAVDRAERLAIVDRIAADLQTKVNPDLYPGDLDARDIAAEASRQVAVFQRAAREKIMSNRYGLRTTPAGNIVETKKRRYRLDATVAEGDLCTIYRGVSIDSDEAAGKVIIKVINDAVDNSFLQKEIVVLKLFQASPGRQSKHLPVLLDEFRAADGRIGVVLRLCDGYDLYNIRENRRYRTGIPVKHMVWMLNRLLSVIGYAHSQGVVHGNIDPSHLMIRPADHNLWLIDWSYAAIDPFRTGDGFKVVNEGYSPPEVEQRKIPLPAADLYAAGKCMIFVLGGDIESNRMPASVPDPLQRFIRYMVMESPLQRAQDAWQLHPQLISMVEDLWGPRKFIPFEL